MMERGKPQDAKILELYCTSANVMLGYATSLPSLKETDLSHDVMATRHLENYCYNFIIKSNTLIDSDKIIII